MEEKKAIQIPIPWWQVGPERKTPFNDETIKCRCGRPTIIGITYNKEETDWTEVLCDCGKWIKNPNLIRRAQ